MFFVVVGFVALVVISGWQEAVPTASPTRIGDRASAAGESTEGAGFRLRDVNGRWIEMGDGRAGAIVVISPRNCRACDAAAARLHRVGQRLDRPAVLVAASLDYADSRVELSEFLQRSDASSLRAAIDSRDSALAGLLDGPELASTVVFDRRGRIAARLDATVSDAAVLTGLRRAGRS